MVDVLLEHLAMTVEAQHGRLRRLAKNFEELGTPRRANNTAPRYLATRRGAQSQDVRRKSKSQLTLYRSPTALL